MFGPKRKYSCELHINKEMTLSKINSSKCLITDSYGPYVSAFRSSGKDELFITQNDSNTFRLSENAGFGRMFEVIGIMNIVELTKENTLLKIKLQMGIYPANFPQIVIMILLFIGLIFLPITSAFLILFSTICFFLSIWWLINYFKIKSILRILSKAIEIENNWI